MKHLFSLFAIVLMSITIASAQQFREVIHLNNGSVIKGSIIEQVPNETYKIETSDGSQFVYSWSEVAKITKEAVKTTANSGVKYQGEVLTGFGAGVGLLPIDRIYLHTIQGVRVCEHFSAGLGIGLTMIMPYAFEYNLPELYMPIYLNMKGYLPVSAKASMFASLDIGGGFGLTEGVTGLSGFMACPALGVCVNNKVNLSLGYEVQKISDSFLSVNMNAVALKIGYIF
ncbi:MAG: hypothetical protein SNH27_15030 [Rikenellaceae bacterium]